VIDGLLPSEQLKSSLNGWHFILGIVTKKVHFMGSSRTMWVNRYSKECGKSRVRASCQVDPSNVYKLGFSAKHAVFTSKSKDWLGTHLMNLLSNYPHYEVPPI
jgi:hypothetical protein